MAKITLSANPMVDDLPVEIGAYTLSLKDTPVIWAIKPIPAKSSEFHVEIGEVRETKQGVLAWAGMDQAFLLGDLPNDAQKTGFDISDGWVFFTLEGDNAYRVLERLCPIDLRPSKVKAGESFRTQLGHLSALVITTKTGFEIGVMSSFAKTARHEIVEVMETLHALAS